MAFQSTLPWLARSTKSTTTCKWRSFHPIVTVDFLQYVLTIATGLSCLRRCSVALLLVAFVSGCWHDAGESMEGSGSFASPGSLPGYLESEASAVSADGRVVAGSSRSRPRLTQAFRWSSAGPERALGFLPQGSVSTATAIWADGAVIVGNADGGSPFGLHAFRWTFDLGLTQLAELPNALSAQRTRFPPMDRWLQAPASRR